MSNKQSIASDIFHEIDKNHDGKISKEELKEGLKLMHLPATDEVVNTLIAKLDTDKNGEVSFFLFILLFFFHSFKSLFINFQYCFE